MEIEVKTGVPIKCQNPGCDNMITKGYRYLIIPSKNKYLEAIKLKLCNSCGIEYLIKQQMKINSMILQLRLEPAPSKHKENK